MPLYAISKIADPSLIRSFLRKDESYAAYALGDLDPPYSDHAEWFGAERTGEIEGLALHYTVFDPEVIFLQGDDAALCALLDHGIGPDRIYFTTTPAHEALLHRCYEVQEVNLMYRMRVDKESFSPVNGKATDTAAAERLTGENADALFSLLKRAALADGRPIHDIAFSPDMLDDGYYYGIFASGQLIAAAGTHLVARQSRIAAVGNVVTDPSKRRQGFAKWVTSAVTRALLDDRFEMIVLNVQQSNAAAVAAYLRLGYRITCEFIEGLAVRR
jgi:ribosomal protein S18 acetylase RimI-like enzyme